MTGGVAGGSHRARRGTCGNGNGLLAFVTVDVGAKLLLHGVFHDELYHGYRPLGTHAVRASNDLCHIAEWAGQRE